MFKFAALVVLIAVAVMPAFGAPPSKSTPLPPSATLFSGDYSFSTVGTTYSAPVSVPVDGAWLTGTGAWNYSSYPHWDCSHSYTGNLSPNFNDYTPLFIAGWQPDRICSGQFPVFGCLTCGVAFGGEKAYAGNYMTTSNTPGFMAAGTGTITLRSNNGGGQSDLLTFFFVQQVNRDAMVNMTIRQSVDEENPTPASDTEVAERYFIANSADRIPVVPIFHYGTESNGNDRQFPAGPGIVWSATWDTGEVAAVVEKFAQQGLHGHSILAVSIPSMPTGMHKFSVKATLPSGKSYTSQAMSVLVYAQNIYITLEGDFKPKAPVDQAPQFIPGSALNGTNLDLRTTPQMVQLNILIGGGSSGTFNVKLSNVSRYPGITMNYPLNATDTNPDMDFGAGDLELFDIPIPKGGAPKVVKLPLYIYDYGASATIEVTMPYRKVSFTTKRRLPVDVDNNGLPDAPWKIGANVVSPTGLNATTDADDDNNPSTPHKGDGLSAFEEMRGIIVANAFTRLDPRSRDFFIVADPEVLAFGGPVANSTPLTYLTPLALWNHYLELEDVSGEEWTGRELTKIKPVVNPNRAGVPGARANGQRALRVIYQDQFYPSVTIPLPVTPPADQDITIWSHGVFGATILDVNDYDRIDRDQSGNPITAFAAETPNKTSFVEWYAKTFENAGIHTDFTDGFILGFHDENGNVVPACLSPSDANCDIWEDHLIVPRVFPGGHLDELHTVPEYAGDYYTRRAFTCADMVNDRAGGMTLQEFMQLKAAVAAHEIGHGLDIDHDSACPSLMLDAMFFTVRRTVSDITPISSAFSQSHRDAIRLKE